MNTLHWLVQTSAPGTLPMVVSEYLLNDMGVFIKRERRMPKKAPLTAITGFRIGYTAVPNTDYRMAPMDRNAILWHKITSVSIDGADLITVRGNTKDVISIHCTPGTKDSVLQFISTKRQQHPAVAEGDYTAASWICWRDDDDWGDAFLSLVDMVHAELSTERYIEQEVLDETELTVVPVMDIPPPQPIWRPQQTPMPQPTPPPQPVPMPQQTPPPQPTPMPQRTPPVQPMPAPRPKFCSHCGELLPTDGNFCENCGTHI